MDNIQKFTSNLDDIGSQIAIQMLTDAQMHFGKLMLNDINIVGKIFSLDQTFHVRRKKIFDEENAQLFQGITLNKVLWFKVRRYEYIVKLVPKEGGIPIQFKPTPYQSPNLQMLFVYKFHKISEEESWTVTSLLNDFISNSEYEYETQQFSIQEIKNKK